MRNIRFWVSGPQSNPVKLTLRPDQSVKHWRVFHDDEGSTYTEDRYTYDTDERALVCDWYSDGTDCDGRLTRGGKTLARLDSLNTGWTDDSDRSVTYPAWQSADEYQRDYSAEAMGY